MPDSVCPYPKFRAYMPGTNAPLVGGQLYTYQAGTVNTPMTTYTDSTMSTPNANPVILNANGEADVWLSGYTKLVLYDALNNLIWSVDNVSSAPASTSNSTSITQWILQSLTLTYLNATQFSTPGAVTSLFAPGTRIQAQVSLGLVYGTVVSAVFANSVTTVTIVFDSGQLDSGLSTIWTGMLTPVSSSLPIQPVSNQTGTAYTYTFNGMDQIIELNNQNPSNFILPTANTVPNGAIVTVKNVGSGNWTITGANVDGVANQVISPYQSIQIYTDGANWSTSSASPGLNLFGTKIIPPIYDSGLIANSNQTFTIANLSIANYYGVEFDIWVVNTAGTTQWYSLYFNGDTSANAANYWGLVTGFSVASANAFLGSAANGTTMWARGAITTGPSNTALVQIYESGYSSSNNQSIANSTILYGSGFVVKMANVTDITSLTLNSNAANGIGVNSRIRLFAR